MLYSAGGGSLFPWALPQIVRFIVGFALMLFIACTDLNWWFRNAYTIYGISLLLLIAVEAAGFVGMGPNAGLICIFLSCNLQKY
ncbi:MAG: hypothetical protein H6925_06695 [Holosporaceae bacterium]|nr:MAG: hypothetical protein H6925_06695 [Holosporaceae bacterium]